ncbi:endonuclease III [Alphaproteobacteria bacterium]|nr:endonuclease III [Alphaproteobacteria bacterium]
MAINKAKKNINEIFKILQKENPHPKTELIYHNNYTLLVAVILSAQTTDIAVNKATKELFKIADTAQKMLTLGENKLKKYIANIGLYNAKAKNVIKMSEILIEKFNSQVPNNFDDLQNLPGVGRKTANVVLNCAFNQPTIAVDTHVYRLAHRLGFVKNKNLLETELALLKIIPKDYLQHAHHWLILHGRYTCKAQKPNCHDCKIKDLCLKNI